MSIKKVIDEIRKNKSFLITSHINLEGDALGSELALKQLLVSLGKKATIINQDVALNEYSFFPGIKSIKRLSQLKGLSFDAFIAVDCSDLGRCPKVARLVDHDKIIINIDHHISNNKFGDVNWVDARSSSASRPSLRMRPW